MPDLPFVCSRTIHTTEDDVFVFRSVTQEDEHLKLMLIVKQQRNTNIPFSVI